MKYVYLAIAAACLYLMLNSRTDPFEIKAGIDTLMPGNTLQASSGHTINARLLPEIDLNATPERRADLNMPYSADYEKLCNTHPVECKMVAQHFINAQ